MKIGGFNLWKWRSNSRTLQQQTSEAEGEADSEVPKVVRVLGFNLDTQKDSLVYKLNDLISFINSVPPTKRSLMRISAKIIDPLAYHYCSKDVISTGVCSQIRLGSTIRR